MWFVVRHKKICVNPKISTMSFHMAKILTCVEGGMIFIDSKKIYSEIKMKISHREKKVGDYIHNYLGTNARLTDMQAVKLEMDIFHEKRELIY